jgi:hypothetical protein
MYKSKDLELVNLLNQIKNFDFKVYVKAFRDVDFNVFLRELVKVDYNAIYKSLKELENPLFKERLSFEEEESQLECLLSKVNIEKLLKSYKKNENKGL